MRPDQSGDGSRSKLQDCQGAFRQILDSELLPQFCGDERRQYEQSGFRRDSFTISDVDAADFVRAWKEGLMRQQKPGLYRAARSAASEQFFWSGPRDQVPRSFTLWVEPVITVAALARLHFNFRWPVDHIGTQSWDGAFDVMAFRPGCDSIAGEIKKSIPEITQLLELMQRFGRDPQAAMPSAGKARNAYKKIVALRARRAPVFWAVGPGGYNTVYRVEYGVDGTVDLIASHESLLSYDGCSRL